MKNSFARCYINDQLKKFETEVGIHSTNAYPIHLSCFSCFTNSFNVFKNFLKIFPDDQQRSKLVENNQKIKHKKYFFLSYHLFIFIYRATTIWCCGILLGVLWASGDDASAPKPCPNPESSSDEGFVRSNAVV